MTLIDRLRLRLGGFDALVLMAIIGLICGIAAGGVNILFRWFTESSFVLWARDHLTNPNDNSFDFENMDWHLRLLLPMIGGLVVGMLMQRLKPENRQVGVSHVLERMAYHQGHLPPKNAFVQFFVGGLTIASGQSVGREGPGIHLGSAAASWIGQKLKLPNNSTRVLVGCGCAAAISASFNTPLAGVVFAMEIIVMEYAVASFIPIILSAVAAAVMTQWAFGADPAFIVPSKLDIQSLWEMPYFLLLGFVAGVVASGFIFFTRRVSKFSRSWPVWIKTTTAGTCVGFIALLAPQVMGIGYDSVNASIQGELVLNILILALVGKFLATIICSGLSLPGGVIGPTLFMGAMLGGVMGVFGGQIFPDHASFEGFYAIIGMATLMSAVLQAPLAGLIALLELTNNPNIIMPGMFSIVIGNLVVTQLFKQRSFWETQMSDRGLELSVSPIKQVLRTIGVAGVMSRNYQTLNIKSSVKQVEKALIEKPRWILIKEDDHVISLMVASDLARYLLEIKQSQEEAEGKTKKQKSDKPESDKPEKIETDVQEVDVQETDALKTQHVDSESSKVSTISTPEVVSEPLDEAPEKSPKVEKINLMKIPANRQDVVSINLQATLEETFDKMEQRKINAAYVYRITHDEKERIYGVITRDMITDQYIYSKLPSQ